MLLTGLLLAAICIGFATVLGLIILIIFEDIETRKRKNNNK